MADPIQGYFNSTTFTLDANGFPIWDRAVGSEFMAKFAHTVLGNGAAAVTTGGFQVVKKTGMTVTVKPYFVCKDGYMMYQTAETDIEFTSSTSEQVFYIGARLDVANNHFDGDDVGAFTTFVSATDIASCKLTITANAVAITDGMIEDLRYNTTYCGQIDEYRGRSLELIADAEEELAALQAAASEVTVETIGAMPKEAILSNLLINGGFDVWQRGTSFSANGYTADRWCFQFNGTGATRAIIRQAFTAGQTDVPNNPTFYLRANQSVAGSGGTFNLINTRIEDVSKLSGKTVTLSFYAKADSARNVATQVDQNFGDGGSSTVYVGEVAHALTTSWQLFTRTLTLPSVSGKTIGANNFCSVYITFPINTTFTIDIANIQLNYGSVALPFVPRSYADELRLCQRYYIPGVGSLCCGYAVGTTMSILIPTTVQMRTNPSVTATILDNVIIGTTVISVSGVSSAKVTNNGVSIDLTLGTSVAAITSGTTASMNLALDAEL